MIRPGFRSQTANTSSDTTENWTLNSTFVLLGMGLTAAALHMALRVPLHLPGRHGLEWLAILLLARQAFPQPTAATTAGAGATALSLLFNPLAAPTYLATALLVDLGWHYLGRWRRHALLLALLAGLAFAVKPLLQLGLEPFPLSELGFRLITHFAFGALGGLAGVGLWRIADLFRGT